MTIAIDKRIKYGHNWYHIEAVTTMYGKKYVDAIREKDMKYVIDPIMRQKIAEVII